MSRFRRDPFTGFCQMKRGESCGLESQAQEPRAEGFRDRVIAAIAVVSLIAYLMFSNALHNHFLFLYQSLLKFVGLFDGR
jgi:hypothetical protein